MACWASKRTCRCGRSRLSVSVTLLLLSIVLPQSSFAQLTNPPSSPTSATVPTTLSTITTSSSPLSSTASPTQLTSPAGTTTTGKTGGTLSTHLFNYYFIIIAALAAVFVLGIFYFGRRRKQKVALLRSSGHRALARDVEGWRIRIGPRNGIGGSTVTIERASREDGLNERGEAPPPYNPGDKPPSIRAAHGDTVEPGVGNSEADAVELMSVGPPKYDENLGAEDGSGRIMRPDSAVVASEGFGSLRRSRTDAGSSSPV